MKKKVMLLLLACCLILGLGGCAKQGTNGQNADTGKVQNADTGETDSQTGQNADTQPNRLDLIKQRGKLIVATSADYPPYEFHAMIDGKDELAGFDMDLARAIAQALDVEIEIQDMGFDAALASVHTGTADLGIAGISYKPERGENFEFSQSYYNAQQGLIVRKADVVNYKEIADLAGKKISAQIGTVQEGILNTIEGVEPKLLPKVTDLVIELQTNMVDGIVMELPVAKSYANQNPDLAVVTEIAFESDAEGSCVIAQKGEDELIAEIDKIIKDLVDSGKMDEFVVNANKLVEEMGNQ